MQQPRRLNPAFQRGSGGMAVKGGGVLMKDAMVRALQSGALALSSRGLSALPEEFTRLDTLEYENKRWYEECDVVRLDVSHNALTALPDNIDELPLLGSLQSVDLLENRLATLPPRLFRLPALTRLNVAGNALVSVPPDLCMAANLQELDLSNNPSLAALPGSLGNLHGLKTLRAANCALTALPESLGGCSALQTLQVAGNKLRETPQSLVLLTRLSDLDVSKNALTAFPLLPDSRLLTRVDVHQNKLTEVGAVASESLRELVLSYNGIVSLDRLATPGLNVLDVRDNKLRDIAVAETLPALQHLNVSNNDLPSLPVCLCDLKRLSTLNVEGNPIKSIRRDVLSKGTVAILKYLESRRADAAVSQEDQARHDFEANNASAVVAKGVYDISKRAHTPCLSEVPRELFEHHDSVSIFRCNGHRMSAPLPREMGWMANLTHLELNNNALSEAALPAEFFELRGLTHVELCRNAFTRVPDGFGRLDNLSYLDLSQNRIAGDSGALAGLRRLDTVMLGDNALSALPCVPASVTTLALGGNRIGSVPAGIEKLLPAVVHLDLSNNDLTSVPPEMGRMTTLSSLNINGNPLKTIRRGVLDKGTASLLAYLRDRIPVPQGEVPAGGGGTWGATPAPMQQQQQPPRRPSGRGIQHF